MEYGVLAGCEEAVGGAWEVIGYLSGSTWRWLGDVRDAFFERW